MESVWGMVKKILSDMASTKQVESRLYLKCRWCFVLNVTYFSENHAEVDDVQIPSTPGLTGHHSGVAVSLQLTL